MLFRFCMVISGCSLGLFVLAGAIVSTENWTFAGIVAAIALAMALVPTAIFFRPLDKYATRGEEYVNVLKTTFLPEPYTAFGASIIIPLLAKPTALLSGVSRDSLEKFALENLGVLTAWFFSIVFLSMGRKWIYNPLLMLRGYSIKSVRVTRKGSTKEHDILLLSKGEPSYNQEICIRSIDAPATYLQVK